MRCASCSHHNPAGNRFCERCGAPLAGLEAAETAQQSASTRYAGFGRRFAAWLIDSTVVGTLGAFVSVPVFLVAGLQMGAGELENMSAMMSVQLVGIALAKAVAWVYEAILNSSTRQATLGKMALGIYVTNVDGQRISFGVATARHFASYLSAIVLFAGYLIQPAMKRKQTLHDLISDTLVLRRS